MACRFLTTSPRDRQCDPHCLMDTVHSESMPSSPVHRGHDPMEAWARIAGGGSGRFRAPMREGVIRVAKSSGSSGLKKIAGTTSQGGSEEPASAPAAWWGAAHASPAMVHSTGGSLLRCTGRARKVRRRICGRISV
eukprot:CAMPEP_0195623782 /NCGR_PEP_ID=MMETSP0815-20121206/16945_1 /TAXON_ID=97485 /ORGANISM="Prymnesium parvum, Strain Texoma1" /LENGTH=135 /DNA_ID=CAMNT_0040764699 /DNA_START=145 /DNA_END=551 /DNA_ORIENTATION=-